MPVPSPTSEEPLGRRAQGADAGARSLLPDWTEDGTAGPGISTRAKGVGRRTAVTYVINEASQGPLLAAESGALQSLREACEAVGAALETLHFGKLDFGETAVLDRFYNAGESDLPGLIGAVRVRVPASRSSPRGRGSRRGASPAEGSAAAAQSSGGRDPRCPRRRRASVTPPAATAVPWTGKSESEPGFVPSANMFLRRSTPSASAL